MSFSKMIRDRIRAGKNVLLGIGMFTTLERPPIDAELLAEMRAPNMRDVVRDIIDRKNTVAHWHQLPQFAQSILSYFLPQPSSVPPSLPFEEETHRDVVVASRPRRQFFGAQQELVERRDHFNISLGELIQLSSLSLVLAQQVSTSQAGLHINLEISSPTLFLLLKLIRGEYMGVVLRDYKPRVLEKIRLEAEALKCDALTKEIERFESRFKS